MPIIPVRLYIDPVLSQPCQPILDFTGLDNIAGDMIETMQAYKGVGLAANQIGLSKQLCVMNLEEKSKIIIVANPQVMCYTKETKIMEEGCLSCPGVSIKMERPLGVEIEAFNLLGEKVNYRLTEYDARIFFHEWDHLNGILITNGLMKL